MKNVNKETSIQKINTVGKVGHIISKIIMVFLIIGITCSLIAGIILLTVPKDLLRFEINGATGIDITLPEADSIIKDQPGADIDEKMSNGNFTINGMDYHLIPDSITRAGDTIHLDYSGDMITFTTRRLVAFVWTAVLFLAVNLVLIIFMGKICKAFKQCSSPFEEPIIRSMQNLAWSLIPWAFIGTFCKSIFSSAFSKKISIGIGVDLSYILLILLVFGLAYIFRYGAVLQTESDETL